MRLLSPVDQLLIFLENRRQPMHVGGLFLFELPEGAEEDFVYSLVQQMQTSDVSPTFPFNQVIKNLVFWDEDKDFDVEHHFRHIALPKPARVRELLSYISKEHSRLLDKARPLWECHVIEGIEPEAEGKPKRFGLYFKIHHSLMDGIGAMRLVQKSLSQSPNESMSLPLWSMMTRNRHQTDHLLPAKRSLGNMLKEQLKTIKPVTKEISRDVLQRSNPEFTTTLQAPPSILNQRISSSRRFNAESFALNRFKEVSKYLNVSINDVVLAICAGALRRYLLSMNELPIAPLTAFVPMSLRKNDGSIGGNQISFILCDLGTNLSDPLQRLRTIYESISVGKQRFSRMTPAQIMNYSVLAYGWEGANLVTNAFPKKQAFNLIISNVIGSKKPLYWNGAKLKALYPASILLNGQALNITLTSYLDTIGFGITACSQTLPKTQNLLTYLEDELQSLEQICAEGKLGIRE